MLTKVPVEFLPNISKVDSSLSTATPNLPVFPVKFNVDETKMVNAKYLDLATRLASILVRTEAINVGYTNFKSVALASSSISIDSVDISAVDTITEALNQLDSFRSAVSITLNALTLDVLEANRRIKDSSDNTYEYNDSFNTELEKFQSLILTVRGIKVSDYQSTLSLIRQTLDLSVTEIELMLEQNPTIEDDSWSAYYKTLSKLNKSEYRYNEIYSRYLRAEYAYGELLTKYEQLLKRSSDAYLNILNAAYVRGGDFLRIYKQGNKIIVSAFKPDLDPCPQPKPLWYPSDYIIYEPSNPNCPGQPDGSPMNTTTTAAAPNTLLLSFAGTCTLNDSGYWTAAESTNKFISQLTSNGVPLDPTNAAQVSAAKTWWLDNHQIDIVAASDFLYGMGAAAKYNGYTPLVLGTWNQTIATYEASIPGFYKCLYMFLKDIYPGAGIKELADWATFKSFCAASLPSLTAANRVDIFLTYHWRTYVNVLNSSAFGFLINDDSVIQGLADLLSYNSHLCQRFTFQEVNSTANILGWALTTLDGNARIINTEPDSKDYNVQAQSPLMFAGGQFRLTGVDYTTSPPTVKTGVLWSLEFPTTADPTVGIAINLALATKHKLVYTAVHEAAHTIDYGKGKASGNQFGFSTSSAWLTISGWTKIGSTYQLDLTKMKYPSQVTSVNVEPPPTAYGHTAPWEDFAESWSLYVINKPALQKWYPKRYSFMESQVKPYLASISRTVLKANP